MRWRGMEKGRLMLSCFSFISAGSLIFPFYFLLFICYTTTSPKMIPLVRIWFSPETSDCSRLLLLFLLVLSPFPVANTVNYQITNLYSVIWHFVLDFFAGVDFVHAFSESSCTLLFLTVSQPSLCPLCTQSLQWQQEICWNLVFISLLTCNFKFVVFFW